MQSIKRLESGRYEPKSAHWNVEDFAGHARSYDGNLPVSNGMITDLWCLPYMFTWIVYDDASDVLSMTDHPDIDF
jgi:hypothetical protein